MSKGSKKVTVPLHDALHPKTLSSVLKQAGISADELMGAR